MTAAVLAGEMLNDSIVVPHFEHADAERPAYLERDTQDRRTLRVGTITAQVVAAPGTILRRSGPCIVSTYTAVAVGLRSKKPLMIGEQSGHSR